MLIRLMRSHLRPYRKLLVLIVVLQTVQTAAALSLPTINAKIIDNGVLPGDIGYIWKWGGIMLMFALIQAAFASERRVLRQQSRDGLRPRRPQQPVPPRHRLLDS